MKGQACAVESELVRAVVNIMLLPDIFNDLPDEIFENEDADVNCKKAALAYIPCFFWLPLATCKGSAYCRFCANQALLIWAGYCACIGLSLLSMLMPLIIGWFFFALFLVSALLLLYVNLACALYAFKGDPRTLPFVKKVRLIK